MTRLADAGARALAVTDPGHLSPEDLRDLTSSIEMLRRFLDAAEAHLLAEMDARRVTDLRSGLSTSKWLARRAALPVGVARQRLIVAQRLAALPTGRHGAVRGAYRSRPRPRADRGDQRTQPRRHHAGAR